MGVQVGAWPLAKSKRYGYVAQKQFTTWYIDLRYLWQEIARTGGKAVKFITAEWYVTLSSSSLRTIRLARS